MQAVESVEESQSMAPKCEIVHHTVVKQPKVVPEKATHRWGTTSIKPERQKEATFHLSSVTGTFHDSGLLKVMLFDSAGRSRVVQFTNTRSIYVSGHLQKFLEIIQEVSDKFEINFDNYRNNTVEFNDHTHGDTFRAVIDDPDLSEVKKLAAILSFLVSAPALNTEHVLEIAKLQKSPVNSDGEFSFGNLRYFMFPYFDSAVEMKPRGVFDGFNLYRKNISGVSRLIGFLRCGDETKTLKEFSESVGDDYIAAAMGCDRQTAVTALGIYDQWGTKLIEKVTLPLLSRLAKLPTNDASNTLKAFVLDRILSGETMSIELYDSLDYYLASFLTVDEYEDFFAQLPKEYDLPKEMGPLSLEIVVRYYLSGGFGKVKELLDVVKGATRYTNNFFYTHTVFEMEFPARQKLRVEHFMLLLNDDYRDMPLGWAIPLVFAEMEAEKQEKAKKIEQMVKDGVLPIAA